MSRLRRAKSFWDIMKSVSIGPIAAEASRTFAFGVVGPASLRRGVLARLYPGLPPESVTPTVRTYDGSAAAHGFPQETGSFDVVISVGEGRDGAPPGLPIYDLDEIGSWDRLVAHLLDDRPDLHLALARRFPGLRDAVSARIIRETALANAEFAMLNALPGIIPVLGILIPTAILGDVVLLAKNQAMMLCRLAAAHELPLDLRSRTWDLGPLLGNALGWRALAREIVGFVPGGIGLMAKGSLAYAGTVTLGEAARRYYALGERPSRAEVAGMYRDSVSEARLAASGIAKRITGRRRRKALPPVPQLGSSDEAPER